MQDTVEKRVSLKLDEFERRIKNSFSLMKQDMELVTKKLDDMRSYMNDWDKKSSDAWKLDEKVRDDIRRDLDDLSDKTSQFRLALSSIKSLKNELVVIRDLSKIEEKIKDSFRDEISSYKDEIVSLRAAVHDLNVRFDKREKRRDARVVSVPVVDSSSKKMVKKLDSSSKEKDTSWSFFNNFPEV